MYMYYEYAKNLRPQYGNLPTLHSPGSSCKPGSGLPAAQTAAAMPGACAVLDATALHGSLCTASGSEV